MSAPSCEDSETQVAAGPAAGVLSAAFRRTGHSQAGLKVCNKESTA